MIEIKCVTRDVIKLSQLKPFQGDLKKRTPKQIQELGDSIKSQGLLMPFAVWQHEDNNLLLDGHGRLAALTELALYDKDIIEQPFPCVYIEAETEDEAKKSLLQITSSYGKITKEGAIKFCASIPEYKAPAVNNFVHKPATRRKIEKPLNETVIRISVPTDKAEEVKALLAQVNYIKVL